MNQLYISKTTDDLINNYPISISISNTSEYINIKYFTRLQKNLWSKSKLFWSINLNTKKFYSDHIIKLMKGRD